MAAAPLFKVYSFSMGFTCCIHRQVGISSKDAVNFMRSELLDLPDWEGRSRHGRHGKKSLVLSCFTPLFSQIFAPILFELVGADTWKREETIGNVQRLVLKMILLMERRFGFRANWGFWWFKLLVSQVGKVPWQNCLLGHVLFDDRIYNRQTADGRANRRIYWQFSHCRRAWTWLMT